MILIKLKVFFSVRAGCIQIACYEFMNDNGGRRLQEQPNTQSCSGIYISSFVWNLDGETIVLWQPAAVQTARVSGHKTFHFAYLASNISPGTRRCYYYVRGHNLIFM